MSESVNVIWNAEQPKDELALDLLSQIPPSGESIVSNPINLNQAYMFNYMWASNPSETSWLNGNLQGNKYIYVKEYNDLFVVNGFQFKASSFTSLTNPGTQILVFHDFINNYTNKPHIDPANCSVITIDPIANLSNLNTANTSGNKIPQLAFWKEGYLFVIHPLCESVPAGSGFDGVIERYSYDGIRLTKIQSMSVGLGSRDGSYTVSGNVQIPIKFELMPNGLIYCGGTKATSVSIIKLVPDVANDTFDAQTLLISIGSIYTNANTLFDGRISCFYFSQAKKWVYFASQKSTSTTYQNYPLAINVNVNETDWSAFSTSISTRANWSYAAYPYFPYKTNENTLSWNIKDLKTVLNRNNETVVYAIQQDSSKMAYADSLEQLTFTKRWNSATNMNIGQTARAVFNINGRLLNFNYNNNYSLIYDNKDYMLGNNAGYYPTRESLKKYVMSWTDDGQKWYMKAVPNGLDCHFITATNSDNQVEEQQVILGRYLIAWTIDYECITTINNFKAKMLVIDLAKKI